jgi:lactoylglutathione lyase
MRCSWPGLFRSLGEVSANANGEGWAACTVETRCKCHLSICIDWTVLLGVIAVLAEQLIAVEAVSIDRPTGIRQGRSLPPILFVTLRCLVKPVAVELDHHVPGGHDHVAVQRPARVRVDDRVLGLDRYTDREEFVAQADLLGACAPQDALRAALTSPLPQFGGRWITVAPLGSTATLALIPAHDGVPAGVETGIRLTSPDAAAAHQHLRERGVDVGELLHWEAVPPMFAFRDADRNGLEITQDESRS